MFIAVWIAAFLISIFSGAYLAFAGLGSFGPLVAWLWVIPIIIKESRRKDKAELMKLIGGWEIGTERSHTALDEYTQ